MIFYYNCVLICAVVVYLLLMFLFNPSAMFLPVGYMTIGVGLLLLALAFGAGVPTVAVLGVLGAGVLFANRSSSLNGGEVVLVILKILPEL